MHTFMDAKLMAKLLRQALAERNIEVSHSDSLELLARQFGVANWNILSAKIEAHGIAHELVPKAWSKSGNNPSAYRINVDQTDHAAVIESKPRAEAYLSEADFCTLMQAIDASDYRGKRTRLRCQIKSVGVSGGVTRGSGSMDQLGHRALKTWNGLKLLVQSTAIPIGQFAQSFSMCPRTL